MKKKATIVIVTICLLVVIIGISFSAFRSSEVYRKNYISSMDAFGTKISTVVLIPCAVAILAIYISILYPMYTIMNATNSV